MEPALVPTGVFLQSSAWGQSVCPRLQAGGHPHLRTAFSGDPAWVTVFHLFFPILTASPHLLGKGLLFLLDEILSYPDEKY